MRRQDYIAQVELLLDCLPSLKEQRDFALKGGTAINFFIRELPRLSVDIDLTFVDVSLDRKNAIHKIEQGLLRLAEKIKKRNRVYRLKELRTKEGILHKLIVDNNGVKVKIEPNFIMRGVLNPLMHANICQSIENQFAYSVKDIPLVSLNELYAGKICAALSRQHPRDLFDIKILMENEGITRDICSAFVVYLACSPRPIHELLNPNMTLNRTIFENEFVNMTEIPVNFEELVEARKKLIDAIKYSLTDKEKSFLISMKAGKPEFTLLPYKNLSDLPALKWKVINIQKMRDVKRKKMMERLKFVLNV